MTESDQESESVPPPEPEAEPEVEPETNGVSGPLTTEAPAQEELVEAATLLLEKRTEGTPHVDKAAIVIPESSMLRAKPTPSISYSPASSPRLKQTTTSSPRTQEIKTYTPRRRKLLESESENEMESEVNTTMEQGDATRVESEPTEPARRNLVLGDDSDEVEVENEPVEIPDWTFEESTKDVVATIDKRSTGSSSAHSPKQISQREQQGRTHEDKEVHAADVAVIKTTSRRRSTGKTPLTRMSTAQAQEEPIFVVEASTTNMLLTESRTPLISGTIIKQKQDDPICMEEVRTTNRLLSKSNAPFIFHSTSTQEDQEHSSISRESSLVESDAKEDEAIVATPPKAAVDQSPIQAEEMKEYQQHFRFREKKKPYRQVDYVRKCCNFVVLHVPI